MMDKILVINGSYHDDGITDQTLDIIKRILEGKAATVDVIYLRDYPIGFCFNCRECTQIPGDAPSRCVQDDGMTDLVAKIEAANAYILAAPTNLSSVTAVFKRFMERLAVYAYWPWGRPAPKFRKAKLQTKKALIVSSCAAPGFIGRWLFSSYRQLKMTANVIGAKPVGTLFTGLASNEPNQQLTQKQKNRAETFALKLLK